jgi:hypothetical protein
MIHRNTDKDFPKYVNYDLILHRLYTESFPVFYKFSAKLERAVIYVQ